MSIRRMVTESGVERAKSSFAPGWKGWLLLVAVSVAMCLSPAPASASVLDVIEEISVNSVDTIYTHGDGRLLIEQTGLALILEIVDNVQPITLEGIHFRLETFLDTDTSFGGLAIGEFTGGTILIEQTIGVTTSTLFEANVDSITIQGSSFLGGAGSFINGVLSGSWASTYTFTSGGDFTELAFNLNAGIDDFDEDSFTAESDVTLMPEPATMSLLALGGVGMLIRKRRGRGV